MIELRWKVEEWEQWQDDLSSAIVKREVPHVLQYRQKEARLVSRSYALFSQCQQKRGQIQMSMNEEERKRTLPQNKSMHKYFRLLADELNDAGLDMKKVLKPEINIPWTEENVKNHLWREIQIAMFDKQSTTQLTTVETTEVYKVLDRHLGEKLGVHVEWPSLR